MLRLTWTRLPVSLLTFLLAVVPQPRTPAANPPAPRVYRDRIEPHWIGTNDQAFWYRNDLAQEAREFILVRVPAAERRPAFDHDRLAQAWSRTAGKTFVGQRLPIDQLTFAPDLKSVTLAGPEGEWRLDLESYEIKAESTDATATGLPAEAEIRPSTRTGPESAITFDNRLDTEVELFWIDPDGNRQPYGRLHPKETRRQSTYAGHVWAAIRQGQVLAVFEAQRAPRVAVLDGRPAARRRIEDFPGNRPNTMRSPDGRAEAFVRDHNLWIREFESRAEYPLTFDGNPGDSFRKDVQRARLIGMDYDEPDPPATLPEVHWSPDSSKLVALQTRSVPERRVQLIESSPKDQTQPRLSSYPYLKAGDEIPTQTPRLFDRSTRKEIPFARDLFPNPWELGEFRWAPDSSRFTFLYNQRGHQVMRVLAVTVPHAPLASGESAAITALIDERCATFFDYSNKTYLEFLDAAREVLWMSERDGWNHLYLFNADTGQLKNAVTHGDWVVRGVDKLDVEKRQIWFRVSGIHPGEDPYHIHLARVNLDGSGLNVLTAGDGTHEVQGSPGRESLIDTWSRVDQPPISELRRARDGSLVCRLEEADAREVTAARGRFPERFVAPGRDGTTPIWGILHRPRNFQPTHRYPVLENIYAGPHGQHVPKAFHAQYRSAEELADRGFIVVQIDGMGTNWRNKRFHDVAWQNLGDAGFPDRIAWLKAAAGKSPELDLGRIGLYGGSAGGQNALRALLAHGDFYRAGVADCGCHDNRMDKIWWNEAWMGWPVGPHYAEQSNVTQAHRLQGSLLLVVGELDRNVDPASTTQVVNALVKADKDFDFLLVPGTGHGAAESDYGRRRRADFFVRHLRGP